MKTSKILSLEHNRLAYHADFVSYGCAILALTTLLVDACLRGQQGSRWLLFIILAVSGLASWTGVEYFLHRFVMHGLQPFKRWHAMHHARPAALISTPTVFTALLFAGLVFLPARALGDRWEACAWTAGMLAGYLSYGLCHHAIHHWHGNSAWLLERKRWHAVHHHCPLEASKCFGVSTGLWDRIFDTAKAPSPRAPARPRR